MSQPDQPVADPHRQTQGTRAMQCKPAPNAFAITFERRIYPAGN